MPGNAPSQHTPDIVEYMLVLQAPETRVITVSNGDTLRFEEGLLWFLPAHRPPLPVSRKTALNIVPPDGDRDSPKRIPRDVVGRFELPIPLPRSVVDQWVADNASYVADQLPDDVIEAAPDPFYLGPETVE